MHFQWAPRLGLVLLLMQHCAFQVHIQLSRASPAEIFLIHEQQAELNAQAPSLDETDIDVGSYSGSWNIKSMERDACANKQLVPIGHAGICD